MALNIRVLQGQGVAFFRAGRLSQIPQVLLKLSELIGKLPESSKMESKVKNGYLIDKINLEGMIFAKKGLWDKAFAAFDQGLELSRSFKDWFAITTTSVKITLHATNGDSTRMDPPCK